MGKILCEVKYEPYSLFTHLEKLFLRYIIITTIKYHYINDIFCILNSLTFFLLLKMFQVARVLLWDKGTCGFFSFWKTFISSFLFDKFIFFMLPLYSLLWLFMLTITNSDHIVKYCSKYVNVFKRCLVMKLSTEIKLFKYFLSFQFFKT